MTHDTCPECAGGIVRMNGRNFNAVLALLRPNARYAEVGVTSWRTLCPTCDAREAGSHEGAKKELLP